MNKNSPEYTQYKKRYAVYAHRRKHKEEILSDYIHDYCIVYARENFKSKYPEYVIDLIRLANGLF